MRTKCDKSYVDSFPRRGFQGRGKIVGGKRIVICPMRRL